LFLAADPLRSDRTAFDLEAREIQVEIERSAHRDRFELVTRWAAQPLDLLRELRRLEPTIVHVSGHGGAPAPASGGDAPEVASATDGTGEPQDGLYFQGKDGRAHLVPAAALAETFGAAGGSVKLVVLSACYSHVQATGLVTHVDAAIGTAGSIRDDAAISFAAGLYGGLADGLSVAAAFRHGCAAMGLYGLPQSERPQLALRSGADASTLWLQDDFRGGLATSSQRKRRVHGRRCGADDGAAARVALRGGGAANEPAGELDADRARWCRGSRFQGPAHLLRQSSAEHCRSETVFRAHRSHGACRRIRGGHRQWSDRGAHPARPVFRSGVAALHSPQHQLRIDKRTIVSETRGRRPRIVDAACEHVRAV